MIRKSIITIICSFSVLLTGFSQANDSIDGQQLLNDPKSFLEAISNSSHQLNYEGVFVVQHDTKMLASKIVHCSNGKGTTKINTLDGLPREIISTDEVVKSFFPAFHSIRLEQGQVRRLFPNLITEPVDNYLKNYNLRYIGDDRVATRSCHVVEFLPKDNLRYPHVFCVDNTSNLVLRSSTLGTNGEPLLTSFFTEIKLEKNVSNNALSPSYKDTKNWQVENVSLENQNKTNTNLIIGKLPPGFERISEFTRNSPHNKGIMIHQMYSDGLSSFSVFVEESAPGSKTKQLIVSKMLQNSLSFYSAQVDNHIITVVGDLPLNSVKQIVSSVSFSRSSNQ